MTNFILPAISLLALIVAAISLVSRHHLRIRHEAAKKALTRVANERDQARWALAQSSDKGEA